MSSTDEMGRGFYMLKELDTYDSRCHGVGCNKRNDCLRFHEKNNLMPWTPIVPNLCVLEGKHWYKPHFGMKKPAI